MALPSVADATLVVTVALPIVAFLLRKRIGRYIFTQAIEFVRARYLEEVDIDDGHGHKTRLMRPNALGGALLSSVIPGFLAWARENVKIKLPPFELPAGTDLRQAGMSVLTAKVLSGKKLRFEDAIPVVLGYAKDWADRSGILEKLGQAVPTVKKTPVEEAAHPFMKQLGR